VLLHRADDGAARVEDQLLVPYRARHPGLEVTRRTAALPDAEYHRLLLVAAARERLPDVFQIDAISVPDLADEGRLLDFAPWLARAGVDLARYDPTILAMFRRGAGIYALPRGFTPLVVVYNRDLFDRAGIAAPADDWTWDDFQRAARRLTHDEDGDGRLDHWGVAFDRRPAIWIPWIWAGGGDVLCPDGRRASGCLDSPATVAAIRWYAAWVKAGTEGGPIAPRLRDPRDANAENRRLFAAGRVALLTVGHEAVPDLRAAVAAGRLRVGFASIPHRVGVEPATVLLASGYAVPARTSRRKAAVELAADLTDSLAGATRAEAGIELPAVTTAAQALALGDTLGWEAVFLHAAARGRPAWRARVSQWEEVETVLAELMERVAVDGADPAAIARASARELDRLLGATR
jgi:multiple sugar transport system substrate-binding protein